METTITNKNEPNRLRLLPGVVIVIIQWLIKLLVPVYFTDDKALMVVVFGGVIGGLAIAVWWLFFSRAPLIERWGGFLLIITSLIVTSQFLHISIATANMGLMFTFFSIPVTSLALVVWAIATSRLSNSIRRITMACTILISSGGWALLRTEGMSSDLHFDYAWRWSKTYEEEFLDQLAKEKMVLPVNADTVASWPGFRGQHRDGIIHGVKINSNWKDNPPKELWRKKIGPGCSSFAVCGELIYTQEQRGEEEAVTCYNLNDGKLVWIHKDKARFWDSHAGAGPRATPTYFKGRIYTLGGTGILNALNARDGSVFWTRNVAEDTKANHSGWGFTGSPLIVDSIVIAAASGHLAAYDLATGKPRWYGPDGGKGYSSPHLLTIDGIQQVLFLSKKGVISLKPDDGNLLWNYPWPKDDRILQPAITSDGDIIVNGDMNSGIRHIKITHESKEWKIKEIWTSDEFRAYFNDYVIHKGYIYGFNGRSLACIDIKDGKRQWQGGHLGGQLILLADQDLLLIISEKGELALVPATPDRFTEIARIPAIKGKTWNHPVLTGNVLLVRNSLEMAAYRLPLARD